MCRLAACLELLFAALVFSSVAGSQSRAVDRSPEKLCFPKFERLLPPAPPFVTVGANTVHGVSQEHMVYTEHFFAMGDERDLIWVHHIPSGTTGNTGLVSDGRGVGYAPGSGQLLQIDYPITSVEGTLHWVDLGTLTSTNLGLTTRPWMNRSADRETAVFAVKETTVDENGDGDLGDWIAYGADLVSGAVVSSRRATSSLDFRQMWVDDVRAAWLVPEPIGTDWTGDGDSNDDVYFVHDFMVGAGIQLGLASGGFPSFQCVLRGDWLVFPVNEGAQGSDLNGDGDLADEVMHSFHFPSRAIANLGFVGTLPSITSSRLAVRSSQTETILIVDLVTSAIEDLGIVASPSDPLVRGDLVFYVAEESSVDWNADGDLLDDILWVHDPASGQSWNLGASGSASRVRVDDRWILYPRSELAEGSTDLNGDGDVADSVLSSYDRSTGRIISLGYAALSGEPQGEFALVNVHEDSQGQDLDGDGALDSTVLLALPPSGRSPRRVLYSGASAGGFERVPGLGLVGVAVDGPLRYLKAMVLEPCAD